MIFHCKLNSEYSINGNLLSESTTYKDLGVNILSWRHHYDMIILKAYKSLGLLQEFSLCPGKKISLHVRANLLYYSPLWSPYLLKDIDSPERVQGQATKFIPTDYIFDYKTRLMQLGMLPLMCIYELKLPTLCSLLIPSTIQHKCLTF